MRRVRYAVAASLDGFIADPQGAADWVVMDPSVDFDSVFRDFDTILVGRRTFDGMVQAGAGAMPGMRTYVFSTTLAPDAHPDVTVVASDAARTVAALRAARGKDIWLFGGGTLFHSLLMAGVVDTVEVALMPVLLGGGTPLLPPSARRTQLTLIGAKPSAVGVVSLEYAIVR